jgi:putative ATP-binding cassette transporter
MATDRKQIIRLTAKRLSGAVRALARSEQGPRAAVFAATLIALMLGINGLNVLNSFVGRDFMSAIESRNVPAFWSEALLYALVFLGSSVAAALYRFCEEHLGILWREQLTWRLADAYLSGRTYHRMDSASGVANPDQRIAEDVKAFTTTTLSFLLLFLNGSITAVSFSGVLWSISPMLFAVAAGYAACGSLLTILLGRPLIRLNYHQLDMEADFRSELIHVRENSESIALSHREGRFKIRLRKRLDSLARNFRRLIVVNRNLGFFTNGYNYFIQIIPALIIAPMFMAGKVEFGVITQSTMAFATLLGAFSLIVTQFQSISTFTAVTARLHVLTEAIDNAQEEMPAGIRYRDDGGGVSYEALTLRSADGTRLLLEGLDLRIPRGERWLVSCGEDMPKVALFRATAGVWDQGTGAVARPGLDDILFLPERPYLPPGTLRDVLLRSGREFVTKDAEVHAVLRELGIDQAVRREGGLDAEKDWDEAFSIGEQHLLSVARIFLADPVMVFLDRPGSSLPRAVVSGILDKLAARRVGVVVLAQEDRSHAGYDGVLEIRAEGRWEVQRGGPGRVDATHADLKDLSC